MSNTAPGNPHGDSQESAIPVRSLTSDTSDAIENQLMLMWREASGADLAPGKPAVARASVMTLVAYGQDQAHGQRVAEVVGGIIAQVAARAIVLVPVPAQPAEMPIEVSLSIKERDANNNPGHGEEILIQAHDDAVWHLPGAVLPLVLSGLPSFLWWTGEPPWHTELFDALVDGCDRLLVDSSEVGHVERTLVRLAELVGRKKAQIALTDLNWPRQAPWRELVAQFFDAPSVRPYLDGIDHVTIEYAAGEEESATNPAQAYLMTGWLASRLGWVPHGAVQVRGGEPARECTLISPHGRTITVEMNARYDVPIQPWIEIAPQRAQGQPSSGAQRAGGTGSRRNKSTSPSVSTPHLTAVGPGTLMSVHLHATTNGKTGTFTVAREADLETASLLCQADCAVPSQSAHLPRLGELHYLVEQLQILEHDMIYEQALAMAARLVAPVGQGGRRSTT